MGIFAKVIAAIVFVGVLPTHSLEANGFAGLKSLAKSCFGIFASQKIKTQIPLAETVDYLLADSPQTIADIQAIEGLHPLIRFLTQHLQEQFQLKSEDRFIPSVYRELREMDLFLRQKNQTSFRKGKGLGSDLYFEILSGDLNAAGSVAVVRIRDKGIAKALLDYAHSRWLKLDDSMKERLDLFEDLLEDPRFDANSLWRWLLSILSQRSSLLESDAEMFQGTLDELLGIAAVGSFFDDNPRLIFSFAQESRFTKSHKLSPSFDILARFRLDDGTARLLAFYEIKRKAQVQKAGDVRSLIRSAIEKALANGQRDAIEWQGSKARHPEIPDTLKGFGVELNLILQVDWTFDHPIEWMSGESQLRRHSDGSIELVIPGESKENSIQRGNLVSEIEKLLPAIKGIENLGSVSLMTHEGFVLGTFYSTARIRPMIENDQTEVDAGYVLDPEFVSAVQTQSWIYVVGLQQISVQSQTVDWKAETVDAYINFRIPTIPIIAKSESDAPFTERWEHEP